jgi:hypothetical protein
VCSTAWRTSPKVRARLSVRVDQDAPRRRAVARVGEGLRSGAILALRGLDRAVDGLVGHVVLARAIHRVAQGQVHDRVAAAGAHGGHDQPRVLGEGPRPLRVHARLAVHDVLER